jgi:hypothetical protein
MTQRIRLSNRRGAVAVDLMHRDQRYRAHVGFFENGKAAELFIDAARQNSALDAFAADCAILISLLLQRGSSIAEIGHALRRESDGKPASLIGAVIDQLREMESAS